jgi:tetratricopeptide (TPR) repeat protein
VILNWFARLRQGLVETWEVVRWNTALGLQRTGWWLRARLGFGFAGLTGGPARRLWGPLLDRLEAWWAGPHGPFALGLWLRERDPTPGADLRLFLWRTRLQGWLRTRNYWHLVAAVPVLLFSAAVGVLLLWGTTITPEQMLACYRMRARYASLIKNYGAARVCYERLANLGEDEAENRFRLALALEALGQHAQATALRNRLVSPREKAYAPALLHEAKRLLDAPGPSRADEETAERYLRQAIEETAFSGASAELARAHQLERLKRSDPALLARLEALLLLGKRYLAAGRTADGEKCLQDVVAEGTPPDKANYAVAVGAETATVAEAHRVLGKYYVGRGKLQTAEIHLLVAANRLPPDDPGRVEVQALLGRAYLASNLPDEAEPCLLRVLEANLPNLPATVEAHALMAQRYASAQRYGEAEEELLQVLNAPVPVGGLSAKARALLGQVYLNTRRSAEAERQLLLALKAPKLEPAIAAGAHVLLGRIYLTTGRYPEAERLLQEVLAAQLPAHEATTEAHALIGQLYEVTGRRDKAEYHLTKAAEKRPELGLSLGRLLLARGDRAEGRYQLGRALLVFRRHAEADPTDVQSRLNWAQAATLRGEPADAVAVLLPAVTAAQVRPAAAGNWRDLGLGAAFLQQYVVAPEVRQYGPPLAAAALQWLAALEADPGSDPARCLEVFDLALRHDPGHATVVARLAAAVKARGTEADVTRGLLTSLLDEGLATVAARLLLALDQFARGDNTAAGRMLREVLRQAPQVAPALHNLALLLAQETARLPQALVLLDAAVARWPSEPQFRDTRGQMLTRLGRWEEARADLEAALPGVAYPGKTHRALAEVYERLGKLNLAAEHRRHAADPRRHRTAADPGRRPGEEFNPLGIALGQHANLLLISHTPGEPTLEPIVRAPAGPREDREAAKKKAEAEEEDPVLERFQSELDRFRKELRRLNKKKWDSDKEETRKKSK